MELPINFIPVTFGQMDAILSGKPAAASMALSAADIRPMVLTSPPLTGVHVGLDVQDIKSLPLARDYWEHEFYAGMFGACEIAYAVVHPEPRIHLAGFWCAKEALRKCDRSFATAGFETTVVAHDPTGRPYLVWRRATGDVVLPHALSLSHTGEVATAVVIAIAAPAATSKSEEESPPQHLTAKPAETQGPAKLLLSAAFLLVIVVAGYVLIKHLG